MNDISFLTKPSAFVLFTKRRVCRNTNSQIEQGLKSVLYWDLSGASASQLCTGTYRILEQKPDQVGAAFHGPGNA